MCNAFEASGEFQTLVANLYGTAASDNERTEHFVNNFYLGAYGRDATSTELQQQRDALNTAAAQSQAAVQAQAETFGRSLFTSQVNDSSLSNTQYVTNLYEAFLQRGPDAGGLGFWAGQASVGQARQNVLGAFATCGAFYQLAGTLYREANWLVADHLGTPRMIVSKSGSLASSVTIICRLVKNCLQALVAERRRKATPATPSARSSPQKNEIMKRDWITFLQDIIHLPKEDSHRQMSSEVGQENFTCSVAATKRSKLCHTPRSLILNP